MTIRRYSTNGLKVRAHYYKRPWSTPSVSGITVRLRRPNPNAEKQTYFGTVLGGCGTSSLAMQLEVAARGFPAGAWQKKPNSLMGSDMGGALRYVLTSAVLFAFRFPVRRPEPPHALDRARAVPIIGIVLKRGYMCPAPHPQKPCGRKRFVFIQTSCQRGSFPRCIFFLSLTVNRAVHHFPVRAYPP